MDMKPENSESSSRHSEQEEFKPRLIARPPGHMATTTQEVLASLLLSDNPAAFDKAEEMKFEPWLDGLDETQAKVAFFVIHEGKTWAWVAKNMKGVTVEDVKTWASSQWFLDTAARWISWVRLNNKMAAMRYMCNNVGQSLDVAEIVLKMEGEFVAKKPVKESEKNAEALIPLLPTGTEYTALPLRDGTSDVSPSEDPYT